MTKENEASEHLNYKTVFFKNDGQPFYPASDTTLYRGTPENITHQGCLALAIESNKHYPRHAMWNSWRKEHPTRTLCDLVEGMTGYENHAHFFGHIDTSQIDFTNFDFGDGVKFESLYFANNNQSLIFRSASFGNCAKFQAVNFLATDFRGNTKFNGDVLFYACTFTKPPVFTNCLFNGSVAFEECSVFNDSWTKDDFIDFRHSIHKGSTSIKLSVAHPKNFALSFSEANFTGSFTLKVIHNKITSISFDNATFENDVRINCIFSDEASFKGTTFKGAAVFTGSQFEGRTSFAKAANGAITKFAYAPEFFACEIHPDTSFEDAKFPNNSKGDETELRAYRTLKLAFANHQATREELFFFRREMREEQRLKQAAKKPMTETLNSFRLPAFFFCLYDFFSDYGFSVQRPLLRLVCVGALITYLGGVALALKNGWAPQLTKLFTAETWIFSKFILSGAIPFWEIKFEPDEKFLLTQLFGSFTSEGFLALVTLSAIQKLLSFVGWFFVGLALRNHFKVK